MTLKVGDRVRLKRTTGWPPATVVEVRGGSVRVVWDGPVKASGGWFSAGSFVPVAPTE